MATAPHAASTRGHILIDDVVKVYDPEGAAVMAVDHCSLDIDAGEICMIVGPSGCGKTTLLNAIAGFHEITSGRIVMDGELLCSTEKPKSTPGSPVSSITIQAKCPRECAGASRSSAR